MALFQTSVLNRHLAQLDESTINTAYERFKAFFLNPEQQERIRELKEEQYQTGFLTDLFVNILGYTLNPAPNFNLTTEFKNVKNAKKADGAILKDKKAIAVIELKGTNTTDLGKVEGQAFGYKNNQPNAVYVITANFEKVRFYIDNAIEHIEFNLFQLDKEQFKLLWLCLSKDNILNNLPKQIKDASLVEEENITKTLYKDYSAFKRELFDNIAQLNTQYDKLLLFKKTQKLLDRFLFIFFAEDRNLLPPNSIPRIVKRFDMLKELDAYKPLYDIVKQYFGYFNKGRKGKKPIDDIFAYNGGLFANDEVLDSIKIDDQLLQKHTLKLSKYDFQTEIDVNILGHIFEHSLTEIEEITAELNGVPTNKKTGKRKKDGVFYTPKYITKYIVENTVGKLCEAKKEELIIIEDDYRPKRRKATRKLLVDRLESYRTWLRQLTICDPACGSGAFLNQALDFLIKEHRYIDELQSKLLGGSIVFPDITNDILENNLFGVDINDESVEIARLSLWLRTAQKGRKLTTLSDNIKCGNSLIDDPEIAGEKAFDWKKEFPKVFEKGGFDVVIGNPPYVFAREKIGQSEKDYYTVNYNSAEYQVNTYLLFIEKSINIIKTSGFYGLIVPNAWLMVFSAKGLREYILKSSIVEGIVNLAGYSFEGVSVETIILNARKGQNDNNRINVYLSESKEFKLSHTRNQDDFKGNDGLEFRVFSDDISKMLSDKLRENSIILDKLTIIKAGLKAYETGKGKPKQSRDDVKNRPFDHRYRFDDETYPYLEGRDVSRYYLSHSGSFLRYGEHLAAPRTFDLFTNGTIIIREITGKFPNSIIATYTDDTFLFNMSNIAIKKSNENNISLKYVLAILNSSLMAYFFVKNTAKSVRKMFPKIILKDLRKFPIKKIPESGQQTFIEKTNKMLKLNSEKQEIVNNILDLLQAKYELPKVSRKMTSWHTLDTKAFLAELKKAKIKLGMREEMELLKLFKEEKAKASTLQNTINQTDKEIDQMVYQLYGLTDEEIKIVENS